MMFTPRLLTLMISTAMVATVLPSLAEEGRNPASAMELPALRVISVTPLPGIGVPIEKYAGNVQLINSETLEKQNPTDLAEALFKNIGSIDINSAQNNPFQNDVHYRGFLSSPLVGSAIGISTYVDGVRVNEAFGDTVNWDLIPEFAIANITVIPGSNPLFGLNTLGGALSVQTKNGFNFAGTSVDLSAGSNNRRTGTVEHGGHSGDIDWYFGATKFKEDGWRQRSPSDVKQLFSKVGWETNTSDLDLSYMYADNDLIGNGFVPESHLAVDRKAVYTFPDQTKNKLHFLNLRGSHWLTDSTLVAANVFYRKYTRGTLNGDAEIACVDPFGNPILDGNGDPIAPTLCAGANQLEASGVDRNTQTNTNNWGETLQISNESQLAGLHNFFVIGSAYDKADTRFNVKLTDSALYADGLSRGTIPDPTTTLTDVDLKTVRKNWALFFTDTIDLNDQLALTLSGRYQYTNIKIQDKTGASPALNGDHTFKRFSPAVGLSYNVNPGLTVYSAYNESFRTPTAAELTCADPNDPCNLPNSFVADPPLDPVIGKTLELGARGALTQVGMINWSAAIFRTQLKNDLLFTATGSNGAGYFINVAETQRQGLELGLNSTMDKLSWYSNYSFIDATFESNELLASVVAPTGIQVKSGDKLPAIPQHNLKLGLDYAFTEQFSLGGNMTYASSSYMRGDENNKLPKVASYTVFNLNAQYQATKMLQFWLKVDNVLDKDYANSGIRNFNAFPANGGAIKVERFVSPGAPRSAWVGAKFNF